MAQKKKLQVFVSSTYTDLREERQAAVEAILTAGHIPAGMELFAAGDEGQMNVIKRWIDESDVYLLILGGRYGTLEPKSQKSYIHLEYDYAIKAGKPLFAVVIEDDYANDRVRTHPLGVKLIETEYAQRLREFRAYVLTKMVRFWRDPRDIKLAVMETMAEFSRREDLKGWLPGDAVVDAAALATEILQLSKENAELRERLAKLSKATMMYNGVTFEEMYRLLAEAKVEVDDLDNDEWIMRCHQVTVLFGDTEPRLIHVLWLMRQLFQRRGWIYGTSESLLFKFAESLESYNLVEQHQERMAGNYRVYGLTETGKQFLLRLRLERDVSKAETLAWESRLAPDSPATARRS